MRCSATSAPDSIERTRSQWQQLWQGAEEQFITTSPQWFQLWTDAFGMGGIRLFQVDDGGATQLLAPLAVDGARASFAYTPDLVDYNGLLHPPQAPLADACGALLDHLAAEFGTQRLELDSMPEDAPAIAALERAAGAGGWSFSAEREEAAPRKALPADWETYMGQLRGKDRHELRRKLRRLQSAGQLEHGVLLEPRDLAAAAGGLLELIRMSSEDKREYMNTRRESFFKQLISHFAASGQLVIHTLKLDGRQLAASLAFRSAGTLYLYNSGYDPSSRHLAPGLINHLLAIKWAIGQGMRCFDFMRGDERYKYHLGGQDRWLLKLELRRAGA